MTTSQLKPDPSTAHLQYAVQHLIDDARERIVNSTSGTDEQHIGRALAEQLSVVPERLRTNLLVGLLVGAVSIQVFRPPVTGPTEDLSLTPPDVDAAREWIRAHRAERGE